MKSELHQHLAEKMAGEITLSDSPGKALKKWRMNFEIPQASLPTSWGLTFGDQRLREREEEKPRDRGGREDCGYHPRD